MPVNLKQLAALLGLSPTTVSRALGGYDDVSARTRERVEKAARKHGYQPNRAARQIAMGRADAIGIVYPVGADYLGNPAFLEMLAGIEHQLEQKGVDLLLAAAPEHNELAMYERMVRGRRVDAMIVAQTAVKDARVEYMMKSGMPFLAYGRTARARGYAWFDFDNLAGGRLAVRKVAELGHRRIAYVHSPLRLNFAHQRHAGFLQGMRLAKLTVTADMVIPGGLERRAGYAAGQLILQRKRRPTAIVVDSSLGGVGVIRALLDAGVEVGREISVLVYEGVPQDTLLTGIDVAAILQPTPYGSGQYMGDMVLALAAGQPLAASAVLRQPEFVQGTTLMPPFR